MRAACAAAVLLCAAPLTAGERGTVLLLHEQGVLVGDVERQGEQYVVRRGTSETWVPAGRAVRLCADLPAAYAFLRSELVNDDNAGRLRLARWCRHHGLVAEALAEARAVVAADADDVAARSLVATLERVAAAPTQPAAEPVAAVSNEEPAVALTEIHAEAATLFLTKVQPILMNACASCHAVDGRSGAFKLHRVHGPGGRSSQVNLAAVLGRVTREKPAESPLLARAAGVHGPMTQPALKRNTPPYQTLEQWVRLAAGGLTPDGTPPAPTVARAVATRPVGAEPVPPTPALFVKPAEGPTEFAAPPPAAAEPAKSRDPFDPEEFNRQATRPTP